MARLSSTTPGQLAKYVGATVETLSNSMLASVGIAREGRPSSVVLSNNPFNKAQIDRFVELGSTSNSSNEREAYKLRLDVRGTNKEITIGSIEKPNIRVNMGDVAEGVFAAAITAKFVNRGVRFVSEQMVTSVLSGLSPLPVLGRKSQMAFFNTTAPNAGVQVRDGIKLTVTLSKNNMTFLTTASNSPALREYILASLQYANKISVDTWVNTLYNNRRADRIEIIADGVSNQRSTKIDIKVKVTNDKGELQPVNIDVSLKAGEVKQFGQVGGIEYDNLSKLFDNMFGIQVDKFSVETYQKKVISEKDVEGGLNYLYGEVSKKLSDINSNVKSSMARGISLYATGGNENVELVQLSKGEASIYSFKNVGQKLSELKFDATISKSGNLPLITVSSNSKVLFYIRSKKENKTNTKGETYSYYRNYIEKGPLLGELIARAAKDE